MDEHTVPGWAEQRAGDRLGDAMVKFEWPDARTLVDTLGLSRVNSHLERVLRQQAHGWPIPRVEAGVSDDGELALFAREADQAGADLLHVPSFPASIDVLAAVTTDMAEVVSGFRQSRPNGQQLRTESAVFAVGADREGFVQWMTDHVVGGDVSFNCTGYFLEHDPWVPAGVCLVVNFAGVRLTCHLPFPFSVEAFVRSGKAIAHLAQCEWERWAYADYAMDDDELEVYLERGADDELPTADEDSATPGARAPAWGDQPASVANAPAAAARHAHSPDPPPAASSSWLANHPHALGCAVAAALLLCAPAAHPYGYYQILRVVVFVAALGLAYVTFNWRGRLPSTTRAGSDIITAVAVGAALLFNPLVPVTLERSVWAGVDVVTAAFFLLATVAVERPNSQAT